MLRAKFTEDEVKKLLKTLVIIIDTKEKVNSHITDYLDKQKINYCRSKLNVGDYSAYIPRNESMGIPRDLFLPVVIERKNSIDELAQSFKDRARFQNEFIRAVATNTRIYLLVEDEEGYCNIINHKYKSAYEPKAFMGSIKSFEARFDFTTLFLKKELSAHFICSTLYYQLKNQLQRGELND